jgi:homoserine kinase type II
MAEMHIAGQSFKGSRRNDLSLDGWHQLYAASAAGADKVKAGLAGDLARELEHLDKAWPQDLPQGIIHADLFPDNVFFRGDKLSGLIDFYFACNDFFAYDLAICLNAWCFESDNSFNVTKARSLLSAYRKVRPFSPDETRALPVLARGAALRFLLTRLYDWLHHPEGAFVKPKDPNEYVRKLRFHQRVRGPEAYGLEP